MMKKWIRLIVVAVLVTIISITAYPDSLFCSDMTTPTATKNSVRLPNLFRQIFLNLI